MIKRKRTYLLSLQVRALFVISCSFGQHRTIPALRLKHRSGSCGTASALPKCSIMSGCGSRIVLRGKAPRTLRPLPCFGSLFPPLAALTFAASSIICAFGLASAAPRSPYRHLELCGIAFVFRHYASGVLSLFSDAQSGVSPDPLVPESAGASGAGASVAVGSWVGSCVAALGSCTPQRVQ